MAVTRFPPQAGSALFWRTPQKHVDTMETQNIHDSHPKAKPRVTFRAVVLGLIFAGVFAFITVYLENTPPDRYITSTQIAVFSFLLLLVCVAFLNPFLRRVRVIRPLSTPEVLIIFIMGSVSSGISTFGLASPLVPLISGLFNPHWNTDQSRWDMYIEPYVNENFFIAEPGIRDAAIRYRDADRTWRQSQKILAAAENLVATRDHLERLQQELQEINTIPDRTQLMVKQRQLKTQIGLSRRAYQRAESSWKAFGATGAVTQVTASYPEKVRKVRAQVDQAKFELERLETRAFEKVEQFRRGLPDHMRAIPGFVYTGEGRAAYTARISRLIKGHVALRELKKAEKLLLLASPENQLSVSQLHGHIGNAIEALEPLTGIAAITRRQEEVKGDLQSQQADHYLSSHDLQMLHRRRRLAAAGEMKELDRRLQETRGRIAELDERITESANDVERLAAQASIAGIVAATVAGLRSLKQTIATVPPAEHPDAKRELDRLMRTFPTFDGTPGRFLIGEAPWGEWLKPLGNWMILILLTYLMLMTLNVLIYRQWSYNEKLVYPLAELPLILSGADDNTEGKVPPVFKTGLFWAGFVTAGGVLGWNLLATKTPLHAIPLTFLWQPYVAGTFLDGLIWTRSHIFFTLISLTFMVPAKISCSLWMFHFFYFAQILVLVWLGYGIDQKSFPYDWAMVFNFRTAEGGGALLVFAAVLLWKCRAYLLCCWQPGALQDLPGDERRELRCSSLVFFVSSVGLIAILTWGLGVNLFYTVFCYFVVLIITIGLVRAVAEGGLLGFQCYMTPFHLIRSVFGMNSSWTAPAFFAPMMIYYSVLFTDIKTFIAPAMANALKIRDVARMERLRFHVAVFIGILCAILVAVAINIIMGYHLGGDGMQSWFHRDFPRLIFDQIKMPALNPVDTVGGRWWLLCGALLMSVLLFGRQFVAWLPHPIGLIMLVNPLMGAYWSSIFIGWLLKSMISKYGNQQTYRQTRNFFIGMMIAELLLCLCGNDLNRNTIY